MLPICALCRPRPTILPTSITTTISSSIFLNPGSSGNKQQARWGANKSIRWTGKKGNKNYYKGTGSGSMGHWNKGHYVIDPWKVRDYVVPDLNQFELTPYVTPKLDDQEIRVRPFTYKTFMDRHPEGRETMEKVRDAQLVVAIEMVQKLAMEREQLGARRKLGVSKPPLL